MNIYVRLFLFYSVLSIGAMSAEAQIVNREQVEGILKQLQDAGLVSEEEAKKAKAELDQVSDDQLKQINNAAKEKFLGGQKVKGEQKAAYEEPPKDKAVQVFAPKKENFKKVENKVDSIMVEDRPGRVPAGEQVSPDVKDPQIGKEESAVKGPGLSPELIKILNRK